MDNYKEYLDPKDGYSLVKQSVNMPRNPDWIEIPEGSEIAIKFNVDNSGHGVCFYKNNGKLVFSQKNPIWEESEWTQTELLDEDFRSGDVDFTHKVLWIRKPQDQALISGAEALRALMEGLPVEMSDSDLGMDWTEICVKDGDFKGKVEPCLWMFLNQPEHIEFRLKPQTIKLELELPKPFKPRDGDDCFIVDSEQEDGFYRFTYSEDSGFHQNFIQFGAYKTEDDVKKAVEQLRKIRGAS